MMFTCKSLVELCARLMGGGGKEGGRQDWVTESLFECPNKQLTFSMSLCAVWMQWEPPAT
jgi:hypothetical protein